MSGDQQERKSIDSDEDIVAEDPVAIGKTRTNSVDNERDITRQSTKNDDQKSIPIIKQITNNSLSKKLGDSHNNILSPAKLRIVLCAMSMSLMFAFIDQNGISVVLPYIANDLDAQLTISWAGTSQLIANCCFQLLVGRFADIFGRKNVLVFMILMLGIFDLACGLAQTSVQFFIFRAMCGIANGSVMSLVMVVMSDHVTIAERGKYQGYLTAFIGLGNGVGPLLSSAFVQHNYWRNYFFTLFALVTASSSIIIIFLPNSKTNISMKEKLKNIDYVGWVFGSLGLILVLIPINGGGLTYDWNEPKIIIMFVIGGVCFIVFGIIETKFAKLPLVPFKVFRSTSLALIFIQSFCLGVVFSPLLYYLAYYFEIVRNKSVLITACYFLCIIGPHSTFSAISGRIVSSTNQYNPVLWTGFGLWTLTLGVWAGAIDKNTSLVGVCFLMVFYGIGQGMTFQNTLVAALAHSRSQDRAVVISTRNTLRSFGGSLGLGFSSLIFATSFTKSLKNDDFINQQDNLQLKQYLAEHVYSKIDLSHISITNEQHEYIRDIYMQCCKDVFTFWAPIIGVAFIVSWFIKDKGLSTKNEQKVEDEQKFEQNDNIKGEEKV
ncbi:putative MFS-type transporter [Wickerhamomyces ciferrii]|uniref:MFS-type transporter n=1 Tax=Wickerhamomyces ciferrii (strain ATCC 14091 / BCRC 22168 / CBS 111 / JCM 3599 / NBRC 0793 / NRRL Y-1031 F-60-10) TaxID=1206466 RepID=K0KXR9_WICCF|nr:putative MFS-type transporter [Wickerhamomyces ciferrii]CCH46837.1 putative MFS-type transporter [Wickerhamomyces ciferrii]